MLKRPFSYYAENPHVYPTRPEIRAGMKAEIDAASMTTTERELALFELPGRVRAKWEELAAPFTKHGADRKAEFFADCRSDLGYDDLFEEEGCQALENWAWRDHGSVTEGGFQAVYSELEDMVDGLLVTLARTAKKTK